MTVSESDASNGFARCTSSAAVQGVAAPGEGGKPCRASLAVPRLLVFWWSDLCRSCFWSHKKPAPLFTVQDAGFLMSGVNLVGGHASCVWVGDVDRNLKHSLRRLRHHEQLPYYMASTEWTVDTTEAHA